MQYSGLKGIKSAVIEVIGSIEFFRHEAGVHRVQRLSHTSSKERRHTSTATVAVIPVAKLKQIGICERDLEISYCKSQGAGGQHVNTTDSAVRIVHKPTGITVVCQNERSQHQNKDQAMKLLQAKLQANHSQQHMQKVNDNRKNQIGLAERAESIRTYNYIRSEVTDSQTGKKANLKKVLAGQISLLF